MVMHKNGLRCPPHIYQAATWIVYFVNICSFYVVIPASWSLELHFIKRALLLFALIGTYAFGTVIDPTDPLYYKDKKNNFKIEEIDPHDPENETLSYCKICETRVSGTSKHCSSCDRCVEGFDHHCKWLNNCIGKRNYKVQEESKHTKRGSSSRSKTRQNYQYEIKETPDNEREITQNYLCKDHNMSEQLEELECNRLEEIEGNITV